MATTLRSRAARAAALTALMLALAGCGGQAVDTAAWKEDFVGTWALVDYVVGAKPLDEDELALAQAMGVGLTLSDDGTATLELMGTVSSGTWEATADKAATIELTQSDGADVTGTEVARIGEDGLLTIATEVDALTFEKVGDGASQTDAVATETGELVDTAEPSDEAAGEAATSAGGHARESTTTVTPDSELKDFSALDVTVADDDLVRISVIGTGDYYGDLGYLVEVENRTDEALFVSADGSFTVAGSAVDTFLEMSVKGHQTGSEVLWFDGDDLEAGDVSGTLVVLDAHHQELERHPVEL